MAVSLVINGVSFSYPATGDSDWGDQANLWAQAVTSGMLQKAGGAFSLTADVDFGASFGLISTYFNSRSSNIASTGVVRLANTDSVSFRDSGNTADYALKPHADGFLRYNSVDLANVSGTQTFTNKTISGASNTLSNIAYAALVLTGSVVNADVSSSAAIAYSKLNLTGAILNADLAGSIAASKLVGSDIATVGTVTSGTWSAGTIAVNKGGTGVTAVTTAPGATAWAGWDANSNLSANNLLDGYATTATAAGTTTLTVASAGQQYFTGSTTQTCKLPVTSTLAAGMQFLITNLSSGSVTVQSSGSNTLQALSANTQLLATCISTSGTGTASWNWSYQAVQNSLSGGGTVTSVTFTGDGTVLSSTPSSAVTTSGTVTAALKTQTAGTFFAGPTSGSAANPTFRALQSPTVSIATTASHSGGMSANSTGTYTLPAGVLYIRVRMVGGGGGGSASGTATSNSNGANGVASTFGTTLLSAGGGTGGAFGGNNGGAGGSSSLGSGPIGTVVTGTTGGGFSFQGTTIQVQPASGYGGSAPFFGGGGSASAAGVAGGNGIANTGGGGAGGGCSGATTSFFGGTGGGSGGGVDALIASPSASYSYTVGGGGKADSTHGHAGANGFTGGDGADGYIEVTEFYQ